MFEKRKLVCLPSEYGTGAVLYTSKTLPHIMTFGEDNGNEHWTPYHLYILSDSEIKKGDWWFCKQQNTIEKCGNEVHAAVLNKRNFKKVIASTNKSLTMDISPCMIASHGADMELPEIPEDFIERYINSYNAGKTIEEVEIEIEIVYNNTIVVTGDGEYQPRYKTIKVNPDNTISIKNPKDSWSRKEVIDLIMKCNMDLRLMAGYRLPKWIEENL